MTKTKRILTIQDISCVGQCSLTVALPILSACGYETAILPTALLSNHTSPAFSGFTFLDTTDEFEKIVERWQTENIKFDAIYTGYLGNSAQVKEIQNMLGTVLNDGAPVIVDPAMADNGSLYKGFDDNFVNEMKILCQSADIILPNLTEACLLTGFDYKTDFSREEIDQLTAKLGEIYPKATVVLKGIRLEQGKIIIDVSKAGKKLFSVKHRRVTRDYHGTGDIFASVFVGKYLSTGSLKSATKKAADFVVKSIENTLSTSHDYGVMFEPLLKKL